MKTVSYNKDLFLDLIQELNMRSIKYAIIGDYKNLPETIGHDIDIWTNNVKAFRTILFDVARKNEFRLFIDNQSANGCNVALYKRLREELILIKIDVLVDTSYKSTITLIDKQTIEENIIPYNGFYIVNAECEAVMHFLYPIFEWGKVKKDSYKAEIKAVVDSPMFSSSLNKVLGESLGVRISEAIRKDDWQHIESEMQLYKRKNIIRSLFHIQTLKNLSLSTYYILRRKLKPTGKCLAFCGLDGAGKTTIINELNTMFVNLLKTKKVYYGYWRPFVIPEIREIFGKENSKAGVNQDEQVGKTIIEDNKKPKNKLVSIAKFIYYWIDYMLAFLKYGSIQQRGGVVLYDRHYIDMAVHPKRFDMDINSKLVMFMYKFIPKPDHTFFLYCTPEEIRLRKKEFSKEEIQEHIDLYMEKGKQIKNFTPLHTNTSITDELEEILNCISTKP